MNPLGHYNDITTGPAIINTKNTLELSQFT